MRDRISWLLGALVVVVAAACSNSSGSAGPTCAAGQSIACVGIGGCAGGQVCAADGSGYGACVCGGNQDGGVDAATDSGGSVGDSGDSGDSGDAARPSTIGKACSTDATCTGAGEKCSNDAFGASSILPTPVCVSVGCTPSVTAPACAGGSGACRNTSAGAATCSGACAFTATTSAAATGCLGRDLCHYAGYTIDTQNVVSGVGACLEGCTADVDCATGKCQVETGACVASLVTYTKRTGDICTAGGTECNCLASPGASHGMCTQLCVTGSALLACPTGFACDPGLPLATGTTQLFTATPTNLAGSCLRTCSTDADCASLNVTCATIQGTKVCRP